MCVKLFLKKQTSILVGRKGNIMVKGVKHGNDCHIQGPQLEKPE